MFTTVLELITNMVHNIGEEAKMMKYRRTVGERKFPGGPGCCFSYNGGEF